MLVCSSPAGQWKPEAEQRVQTLAAAVTALLEARSQVADHLSERVLNVLYNPDSSLLITELTEQRERKPRTMRKKVEEIVSGAMLESVVSRAKRLAVRREIEQQRQLNRLAAQAGTTPLQEAALQKAAASGGGITWHDLYEAIRKECEEGKDQYIYEMYADDPFGRDQAYRDTEKFHVDVQLPPEEAEISRITWLVNKSRSWRKLPAAVPEAPPTM